MGVLVSVVVASYNAGAYIEECIDSLLSQTYKNIEIIICDDCSTDNTIDVLRKYSDECRVIILRNAFNQKQAFSRNRCIARSKGQYVMIQDADDVAVSDRVEKLLSAFEPSVDFVGSGCFCFNRKGVFETISMKHRYPERKDLLFNIPFVHASMMFKRECIESINGYRHTSYNVRCEDYDLIMRLYAAGYRGKNIHDCLYGYRVNAETIARRTFRARINECITRYVGFKNNGILFPKGIFFVLKPLVAMLYQRFKYRSISE